MKKQILLTVIGMVLLLFLIESSSATTDEIRFIAQQDKVLDITEPCFNNNTYCSGTTECNITIKDPKQIVVVDRVDMTNNVGYHNRTLEGTQVNTSGVYEATVVCTDGEVNGFNNFYFKITYHGKEEPTAFTQIIFIAFFIILLALTTISLLLLVKHLEQTDMDMWDLIIMFGIYIGNFSMKYFNMEYMGSSIMDSFADLFIDVGSVTHIILPTIVFIYCFMKRRWELKEEDV